tara:strand:- start:148 stop:372 length:225 start_codon:yes stop_codon:yes gene_type:complete
MEKDNQAIVERVLRNYADKQINLSSESAREILSRAIVKALSFEAEHERRTNVREEWIRAMERKRKTMERKLKKR